jgi:transcriptional regulator with GAF, ATPase, and Fis domain
VPPLRERGDDVCILAQTLLDRFSQRDGRALAPLTDSDYRILKEHYWPGNVRELINIIERAVITAAAGRANISRALPAEGSRPLQDAAPMSGHGIPEVNIMTHAQLQELERGNIQAALEQATGRIAGRGGAAEILGMKASTLSSRIKALGLSGA